MNRLILRLGGALEVFEKTEQALRQANADNELLRNEIATLRKEHNATEIAYSHLESISHRNENELASLKTENMMLKEKIALAGENLKNAIESTERAKISFEEAQKKYEDLRQYAVQLKEIADKAEKYREAHNQKRREKRARARAEKQTQDGEEG